MSDEASFQSALLTGSSAGIVSEIFSPTAREGNVVTPACQSFCPHGGGEWGICSKWEGCGEWGYV